MKSYYEGDAVTLYQLIEGESPEARRKRLARERTRRYRARIAGIETPWQPRPHAGMGLGADLVDRIANGIDITPDGCWVWIRHTSREGYGHLRVGSITDGSARTQSAHRAAYEALVGPIPEGLEIDHLCVNPPCVNPDHLEPVTGAENQARKGARITHCKHGHEFTPENTYAYLSDKGARRRACRACNRRNVAAYKARRAGVTQ